MKTFYLFGIFIFLASAQAKAASDSPLCNDVLSGISTEVQSSIQDLAKLRFDLDQRLARGENDAVTRTLREQCSQKEKEILIAANLDRDVLVGKLQKEIQLIQSEAMARDSVQVQIKNDQQKEANEHETTVRPMGQLLGASYWFGHVLLPGDRVLVAGGIENGAPSGTTIEIFDAKTGKTEKIGDLIEGKKKYQLTLLTDGNVLALGGEGSFQAKNAIEVINPTTKEIKVIGYLNKIGRDRHGQSLLKDGRVLLVGNFANSTDLITVLDPATGALEDIGNLVEGRCEHGQTVLDDGSVIVSGGFGGRGVIQRGSIERIDPTTGESKIVGQLNEPRRFHGQTLLPDGRILITGGSGEDGRLASIEIFDPKTGQSKIVGHLSEPRSHHQQSLLPDGRVLVTGGDKGVTDYCETIEVIDPNLGTSEEIGGLIEPRTEHAQELLSTGEVLVFGRIGKDYSKKSVELIKVQRR